MVRINDALGDRQTQSHTRDLDAWESRSPERFEDVGNLLGRDADSLIRDLEHDFIRVLF